MLPLKENCIKYKDTNRSNVKEGKKKYGTNTNPKKAVVAILMSAKVMQTSTATMENSVEIS